MQWAAPHYHYLLVCAALVARLRFELGLGSQAAFNPLRAPKPLPIPIPSNFVSKKGFQM